MFSLLGHPSPCFAQSSETVTDIELAVTLYKKGYGLFRQKRFPDALAAFLRSREALPKTRRYRRARNELLYYIAVCYMELGSDRKAREFLKKYSTSSPRKRDKDVDVKERLSVLEKRLAIPKPRPVKRPIKRIVKPPPPPPPPVPHTGGWITLGVGGATLVAALIVAVLAQQKMDETTQRYEQQKTSGSRIAQEVALNFRDAQTRGTTANILYAVGGAAAVAGVILLFTWKVPAPPQTTPKTLSSRPSLQHACKNTQPLRLFADQL
ncbi:MAG: tetratricopeptide repeat protein [Myxococcales bacterium]|nr:tetratricopeptide repeat protein [Myxococcales bacterium]